MSEERRQRWRSTRRGSRASELTTNPPPRRAARSPEQLDEHRAPTGRLGLIDDLALADHYRRTFEHLKGLETGAAEHVRAAELRARQGLRTPDAIHLAVAQLNGCHELWTNDSRLAAASHGLAIDVVRT